jgi:hypothetical protein
LGPCAETLPFSMRTLTPEGTGTGFFAIRDMNVVFR